MKLKRAHLRTNRFGHRLHTSHALKFPVKAELHIKPSHLLESRCVQRFSVDALHDSGCTHPRPTPGKTTQTDPSCLS